MLNSRIAQPKRRHWLAVGLIAIGSMLLVPQASEATTNGAALSVVALQTDGVVGPPGASCGSPVWTTGVSFDPNGWPIAGTRFGVGDGLTPAATIGGLSYGAGSVHITSVTTWDGHPIRHEQTQTNESVRLEFTAPDGTKVSAFTPDLADRVPSASSTVNLGTIGLPQGAQSVRIVHSGASGSNNSLVVTAVCMTFIPAPEPPVTEPPTTEPPVTEPPVTEPPVTEPPTTEPPVTEPPVTEPPTTEPPVTEPPVTEPPVTEPPTTEPPTTEPPTTEPPTTEPPTTKPPATQPPVSSTEAPVQPEPEPKPNDGDGAVEEESATEVLGEVEEVEELPRTGPETTRQLVGVAFIFIGTGVLLHPRRDRRQFS